MADGPNPDGNIPSINDAAPPDAGATGGAPAAAGGQLEDFSLDSTRKRIAFFLLYIMSGVIGLVALVSLVYSANCWFDGTKCTQASQALGLLTNGITPMFTAMVGLVGSVVGFYFGSRQTN
jgi:hypothetical protein